MAIEAGRVGVRADQVDPYGRVKGGGGDTDPAVEKLEERVGSYSFRTNPEDGSAQYRQSDDGDWVNFSSGGGASPVLLWENDAPNSGYVGGTIMLPDLTNYTHLMLEMNPSNDSNLTIKKNGISLVDITDDVDINVFGGYMSNGLTVYNSNRWASFSKTSHSLIFIGRGSASQKNSYSSAFDSVGTAIPYRIYGINLTI